MGGGPIVGPSDVGSLLIMYQDAIERLDFRSDQERREFTQHIGKTCAESLRQSLLTWRANGATREDMEHAVALDKARRGSV